MAGLLIVALLGSWATAEAGFGFECDDGFRFRESGCVKEKSEMMFTYVRPGRGPGGVRVGFLARMESTFQPGSLGTLRLVLVVSRDVCDGPSSAFAWGPLFSDVDVIIGLDGRLSSVGRIRLTNRNKDFWNLLFFGLLGDGPVFPEEPPIWLTIPELIYDFDTHEISIGIDGWPVFTRPPPDFGLQGPFGIAILPISAVFNGDVDRRRVVFESGDPCPDVRRKLMAEDWLDEDASMIDMSPELNISCPVEVCVESVGSC